MVRYEDGRIRVNEQFRIDLEMDIGGEKESIPVRVMEVGGASASSPLVQPFFVDFVPHASSLRQFCVYPYELSQPPSHCLSMLFPACHGH